MKKQIGILIGVFLILGGFLFASKLKLIPQNISMHRTLQGLSYESSGHTGFAKDTGSSSLSFLASDTVIFGDLRLSGALNVNGSASYIPPNNASFTLTGLSEKNWSSLTNIPTSPTLLGITEGYVTVASVSEHVTNPLGHGAIASDADFNIHIATYTAHGATRVVNYYDISDATKLWPWFSLGSNWSIATTGTNMPVKQEPAYTYHNGKLWTSCGLIGSTKMADVWSSDNGTQWTQKVATISNVAFYPRSKHTMESFNGYLWIIGGFTGNPTLMNPQIFRSSDGITWQTMSIPYAVYGHTSLVFNNKLWVIGGSGPSSMLHAVISSVDGAQWDLVNLDASFTPRLDHVSFVYDNKMWVYGGSIADSPYVLDDLWYSSDGANWYCATTSTGLGGRYGAAGCVYNGKMWISGGSMYSDPWVAGDMRSSTDGINWSGISSYKEFGLVNGRFNHNLIPYMNRMYIFGGNQNVYKNDVWYSEF